MCVCEFLNFVGSWGGPNSDDYRKIRALCLLCALNVQIKVSFIGKRDYSDKSVCFIVSFFESDTPVVHNFSY
jgi:hypothetical protein